MRRRDRNNASNIEKLEKELEEKKKFPQEIKEKINSKIFENIIIATIIVIYLASLNIGMNNIPTDTYIMDLKVFSIMLLIITIFILELGYRKDNEGIWLHGIEVMVIGIFTLYLVYLYSIYYATYGTLILTVTLVCFAYYIIKIAIIRRKIRKEYNKSLIDIRNIVKK